jgi:hypothetical protein
VDAKPAKKKNKKAEEHSASGSTMPRDVSTKNNAPFGNANYVIVEEEVKIEKTEDVTSIEDLQK